MKSNTLNGDAMGALVAAVQADPVKPKRKRATAPEFLRYAGGLGHRWVTTVPDGHRERVYSECGTGADAFRCWQESGEVGRIFTRTRRGWREVRPSMAAIS